MIMYRLTPEVNDRAPPPEIPKQERCQSAAKPKKAAQKTRGLKVSNREASNRVVENHSEQSGQGLQF